MRQGGDFDFALTSYGAGTMKVQLLDSKTNSYTARAMASTEGPFTGLGAGAYISNRAALGGGLINKRPGTQTESGTFCFVRPKIPIHSGLQGCRCCAVIPSNYTSCHGWHGGAIYGIGGWAYISNRAALGGGLISKRPGTQTESGTFCFARENPGSRNRRDMACYVSAGSSGDP
jgi:hypothetical protein